MSSKQSLRPSICFSDHVKKPCVWSEDGPLIGLSVLFATLVFLTIATCASAIKNRPCRCHFDVRDSPPNEQRFSRLSEEVTSVRYRSGTRPPTTTSSQPSHRFPRRLTDDELAAPKSNGSAILAFGEPKMRKPDGTKSGVKQASKLETPACCQTGKSMEALPQAPLPDSSTRNLDRLVESSLRKLKAMLPPNTDEDVASSAYRKPEVKGSDKSAPETESTDHHLYETPSGCMLSTLF